MSDTSSQLLVACFCAAWCRTCYDYTQVIKTLKTKYSSRVKFVWIDIEDQADLLDNIDVENFPTLLISDVNYLYFWGTILPHAATASKLIDRVLSKNIQPIDRPDMSQLDQRVRGFL